MTASLPTPIIFHVAPPRKAVKLVRVQAQMPPSMLAWLRLEARRRDESVALIIRQAVLELMEQSKP